MARKKRTQQPEETQEKEKDMQTTSPEGEVTAAPRGEETEPQGAVAETGEAEPAPESSASTGEEAAPEGEGDLEARIATLSEELASARAQAQEYLDGWTRERAAFANYKRRVEEERERQRQQLLAEVVKDFLEVLDDLELALKNRPQGEEGAAWAEGIELIYRKLRSRLEARGVEQVPAEPGQPFDPQYHEAISHEPVDGHESGHIIEVVRPGYRVGEVIIRPALVRVAQ